MNRLNVLCVLHDLDNVLDLSVVLLFRKDMFEKMEIVGQVTLTVYGCDLLYCVTLGNGFFSDVDAPCRLLGCKNRPVTFPGCTS